MVLQSMRLLLCALALVSLSPARAALDLDTVLANMDRVAAEYRGMEAEVRWVKYTKIVDMERVEEGRIKVRRGGNGKISLKIEFDKPYHYYLLVRGSKVEIYKPKIATVEEYDLSRSKDELEQALLLGFGTAGSYLREHYEVSFEGEETAEGEQTVRLGLIPRSDDMRRNIPRLEMWISKTRWQPVRQKLYGPNPGDYRLYSYSNVALNPKLSNSDFRLKIPAGVRRIFPQR